MPNLEPTYLRYVYDSLNKGSLNSENAAALPQGFIGLYEQEFTQKTPASNRKKVLNQLALWALFKGPVSANMAAAVLELEEEPMKDLVDTYSSWFNSPESGKYQLYHERLRVYLLQKLKAKEVQVLNEKLISFLEVSIKQAKGEEDEYYALEHLHQHMALESQLGNHYDRLHSYVNQESLWRRQIQLSKGYAWSQNALQQGIKEGARRNHEMNTIRSTVNSVKLMTQEQNSAEDILNLLNEGDYLTALKRAETWEGERQFKLYLLFIHELTIGTSKEANFRKEACKAVLEAIDQTPEDHSVLDWCKFYPELAIYKYHVELLKMELDGMVIWRRGNYSLKDLIGNKDLNALFLKKLASEIKDNWNKSKAFARLSKILIESKEKEKSLELASVINDKYWKSRAYSKISQLLKDQGDIEGAKFNLNISLRIASKITDNYKKSKAYVIVSKILMKLGEKEKSKSLIKKSLEFTYRINKTSYYDFKSPQSYLVKTLIQISDVFFELGEKEHSEILMKESFEIASVLNKGVFLKIYKVLILRGVKEETNLAVKKYFRVLSEMRAEYIEEQEKAINLENRYLDPEEILEAHLEIHKVLMQLGFKKESNLALQEYLKFISKIKNKFSKSKAYSNIYKILVDVGKKQEAQKAINKSIQIASEINSDHFRAGAYTSILKLLIEYEYNEAFNSAIQESLLINNKLKTFKGYAAFSKKLLLKGKKKESISVINFMDEIYASEIYDTKFGKQTIKNEKYLAYAYISKLLMLQGKKEESFLLASKIKKDFLRLETYLKLLKVLIKQGEKQESKIALNETIQIASDINDDYLKIKAYSEIYKVLSDFEEKEETKKAMQEFLLFSSKTIKDWQKGGYKFKKFGNSLNSFGVYGAISRMLMLQSNKQESLHFVSYIIDNHEKSDAYLEISKILMLQKKNEESLNIVSKMIVDYSKTRAYADVSNILMSNGDKVGAIIALEKSIQVANDINNGSERFRSFKKYGQTLSFEDAKNIQKSIYSEKDKIPIIKGMSEKINEKMELSDDVNPYLYNFSEHTHNLFNILTYLARAACFFEEERNEEKLDMLSEVLDINEWRRISASA